MSIRFIAADMDGTLLNSRKQLSPNLFPVLRQLLARGIRFAVASGRQYYSLLKSFKHLQDNILFIAENGAMVMDGGTCIFFQGVAPETAAEVLRAVGTFSGAMAVLCCEQGAYIEDDTPVFVENVLPYYTRCTHVSDLLAQVGKDRICKVAVFDTGRAEEHTYPTLKRMFGDRMNVCLSGEHWTDLMPKGINKGVAIRACQRQMGITSEECMAFGDYLNDYEMMQACGESYAMGNAHPALKAVCRYVARTNDEDGVVLALREAFGIHAE